MKFWKQSHELIKLERSWDSHYRKTAPAKRQNSEILNFQETETSKVRIRLTSKNKTNEKIKPFIKEKNQHLLE